MQAWDKVFREKGKYFLEPLESIKDVTRFFKESNVRRVLDLGSGTGRHVVYLASRGFDVYGFDQSKTGVAITRQWLRREGLAAHLKVHDMKEGLPYPDGFFDAIVATSALHHNTLSGVKKTIKETERVLHSNGIIFFTVPKFNKKYSEEHEKPKRIGFRTYVPTIGIEKGLPHFFFDIRIIRSFFHNFRIVKLELVKFHYNVIAIKK